MRRWKRKTVPIVSPTLDQVAKNSALMPIPGAFPFLACASMSEFVRKSKAAVPPLVFSSRIFGHSYNMANTSQFARFSNARSGPRIT
jgi:hypothetical protein